MNHRIADSADILQDEIRRSAGVRYDHRLEIRIPAESLPIKQPVRLFRSQNRIGTLCFEAKHLTAHGGLLPVATMVEKLGFQQLVQEALTVKRKTKSMTMYRFVLAMVLACYVGFSRLYHVGFLKREPMLTGILGVVRLPLQCSGGS